MAPRQTMLRILALPLRRPAPSASIPLLPTPRVMTYYHFQLNRPRPSLTTDTKSKSFLPEGGLVNWVQHKAADTWSGFGKSKDGSWQLKLFQYGERLIDRIDFEELALKSVDPSLGPTISHPDISREEKPLVKIPLVYPPSILSGESSIAHLKSLVEHRTPRHRKMFWVFLIAAPLTAPFMIIPIIPNIPFFFCVWRSWSHYRAYRASEYLQSLLDKDAVVPTANKDLDRIYKDYAPKALPAPKPHSTTTPQPPFSDQLLLTREGIPQIRAAFDLGSTAESDMYRAVEQARVREKV